MPAPQPLGIPPSGLRVTGPRLRQSGGPSFW